MNSDASITSADQLRLPSTAAAGCRPIKLALVCDYLEEGWASMDLFGDMLFHSYRHYHAAEIAAEQLRPPFRFRLSGFPAPLGAAFFRNADRLLNRFWDYPRWLRKHAAGFDLFHLVDHSYAQLALHLPPGRTIVTCHDLDTFRCLLEPQLEPRPRWFRTMAQRTLNGFLRCSHVICVSAATKTQLLQHGLFPDDRITVILPGADPIFFSSSAATSSELPAQILKEAGQGYLVHVGSTIRRKRIDILLRVFAEVVKEFPNMRLVRVGGPFTGAQAALAASLGLGGKIVQAPFLTKPQLAAVYEKAAILLQNSDAEGFGLPVIEAMACGCPVVASDIAPLREAGGSAADYCPVGDIETWAARVSSLLRERQASPAQWEVRRVGARRHASAFTWQENARRTISIYRFLCGAENQPAAVCQ